VGLEKRVEDKGRDLEKRLWIWVHPPVNIVYCISHTASASETVL